MVYLGRDIVVGFGRRVGVFFLEGRDFLILRGCWRLKGLSCLSVFSLVGVGRFCRDGLGYRILTLGRFVENFVNDCKINEEKKGGRWNFIF